MLEQLTAAGDQLPQALGILLTYPFPVGTTENIIKGDYANLDLYLNADIGKNLCGLLAIPQLCRQRHAPPRPARRPSTTPAPTTSTSGGTSTPATERRHLVARHPRKRGVSRPCCAVRRVSS